MLYLSTHQGPEFYPGTGWEMSYETGGGRGVVNAALSAGAGGDEFRAAVTEKVWPAIRSFDPDLLILSSGFDGHANDPLASIYLTGVLPWAVSGRIASFCLHSGLIFMSFVVR